MWNPSPSPPASQYPPRIWVGAKKPPLGHAVHTSRQRGHWPEGPCWEAAEGTGRQDAGALARGTDAEEKPL